MTGPELHGRLGRLADLAYRRRRTVLVAWVLAVVAAFAASAAFAGDFQADYSARGSDSQQAQRLLEDRFPQQSGDTVDVVVRADGGVTAVKARVQAALARLADVQHVAAIDDPYETPGAVSTDGRTAIARMRLDVANPVDMPTEDSKKLLSVADDTTRDGLTMALNGQSIQQAEQGAIGSEGLGLAAAALILLLAFGAVVAAGLPILVAVFGLAVSSSLVGVFAAVTDVPDWSTSLAAMMGIGVGIDYVLLLVTRYREFLGRGLSPRSSTVAAVETAGRSVLVAGTTVVISLLGLFAMGLTYMRGAALVTIVAVLVVMASAVTLLPAMLGFVGHNIDRLRLPGRHPSHAGGSPAWGRWARLVQRRPWPAAAVGLGLLLALAAPLSGVQFGFPDAGNSASGTSSRTAYDLATDAFGPGANGPLLVVTELQGAGDTAAVDRLATALRSTRGVAQVSPVQLNADKDTAVLSVTPTTSPQSKDTERLVRRIRNDVAPTAVSGSTARVHVGGVTAASIDNTADVSKRIPALIAGVVLLSMLLLLAVFRSVVIAVKAAVMNLLSIAAAYGVVAYVLEGGWAGKLFGIDTPTPLPSFIPVLMFAVLFGLSMDYEVFLLSRVREGWVRTRDNAGAVAGGITSTARVITAAAAIMVAVFAAFVPSPDVTLKTIGIGMATAIFVDATIVRMLLVPATMQILGQANWYLPAWIDRRLPQVNVEGPEIHAPEPAIPVQGRRPAHVPVPDPA